jgi:hypothetical protein
LESRRTDQRRRLASLLPPALVGRDGGGTAAIETKGRNVKITIVPTSTITEMDSVPVRLWIGQTEDGVRVTLAVHRVIVSDEERQEQFQRDLLECVPPAEDRKVPLRQALVGQAIPWRMVT